MENYNRRHFVSINTIGLIFSGILLTCLSRNGALDFRITQHFFDSAAHTFPLRGAPLLVNIGHTMLQYVTDLCLIAGIVLAAASTWTPRLRPWRSVLITFCVMAICSALLIASLKAESVHSCPWDLAMYGGTAHWLPLFGPIHAGTEFGHCFPGGHASGGYALIAGYFALRNRQAHWARWMLMLGLTLGTIMGTVQIVRGAHFLSHNLWTLWLVWATCFAIDVAIQLASHALRQEINHIAAESSYCKT
jgi:membrane-associated PAP2 superfamily phosphatase